MRRLPDLDADVLRRHLAETWDVNGTSLDPVFRGDNAYAYAARSDDGSGWFVKLYGNDAMPHVMAKLSETVEMAASLRQAEILDNTPALRRAVDGSLITDCGPFRVVVQELVDGSPPRPGGLPADAARQAGATAGRLHARSGRLPMPCPFTEAFSPVGDIASRSLAAVTACENALAVKSSAAARAFRSDVAAAERRVESLRSQVATADDLVLVHADYQGDNMLIDGTDQLWVLDWDTLELAPREHNLALLAWIEPQQLGAVLDGYFSEAGDVELRVDRVDYFLRRYLIHCVAIYGQSVLGLTEPGMQSTWIDGIYAWCLAQLRVVDERLALFATAVDQRGRR